MQILQAFEAVESQVLNGEHLVCLKVDNRRDHVSFVGGVVVHLRGAGRGYFLNVFDDGSGHPALGHQFGRGRNDPSAGSAAFRCQLLHSGGAMPSHLERWNHYSN